MAETDSVIKTLDELKAENAAKEDKSKPAPQADNDEPELDAALDETKELDDDAESTEGEGEKTEVEDWMKSDSHESENDVEPERKYTGSDIGKAKANLKAKLERRHDSETEQLKARIADLEQKPGSSESLSAPKREDFYDEDDPDAAYNEAITDYRINKRFADQDAKNIATNQEVEQAKERAELTSSVYKHYDEAAKLVEGSGISAAAYQNADGNVRSMIDSVFPESGDLIADTFISKLGKGSEKVFYNLGVNKTNRDKLEQLLRTDKSGFAAATYLGELKATLVPPRKKTTATPAPAAKINGDSKPEKQGESQKKYAQAHKKGNFSAAFKLKMEAKNSGVDVKDW